MNKIFMLLAAFAVVIAVFGSMSQFRLGDRATGVFAQEDHGGDHGGDDGGDDGGDYGGDDGGDHVVDDGGDDGGDHGGDDGGDHVVDDGVDDSGDHGGDDGGDHVVDDDGHGLDDGGAKDGFDAAGFVDLHDFGGEEVLTFEYLADGSGLALFQGIIFDPAQDMEAMRAAGLFGDGKDPMQTGVGKPSDAVAGYFDAGTGRVFDVNQAPPDGGFDPAVFSHDFLVETFKPGEFHGNFGDFFRPEAFEKGELDGLFSADEFRPSDFGSLFDVKDFKAGDFGHFAVVGGEFIDFGGHFENFFGERGDEAKAATRFFGDFNPGDFQGFAPDQLLDQIHQLDFQGFQELGKDVIFELFSDGLAGHQFDLQGQQWAGAFSQLDVQDIKNFDRDFIQDAVHDFSKEDFLGIPDDQAFALFESTFFGEGGVGPGGPPSDFDPQEFAGKLEEFGEQLGGFLGAFGKEHYEQLGGDLVADIIGKIDFASPDFDPTVLSGDAVGHAFGAMDFGHLQGLGDKVLEAVDAFEAVDVGRWDPQAAFNVFNAGEFSDVKGLGAIGGLIGAMGQEFLGQVDPGQRVELFQVLNFDSSGEDIDGLDGQDIAALMGGLDRSHLDQLGGQGILNAMGRIGNLEDLGIIGGDTALDVLGAVGLGELQDLDQFDGVIANLRAEHIQNLGGQIGEILANLDFRTNGALLGDFSFGALDAIAGGQTEGFGLSDLDSGKLADLANSVGGGRIFHLETGKLEDMVNSLDANGFNQFDPTAVSGIFAGLNHDQIVGFDTDKLEAAIEAAGANFLGGIGAFDGIAGRDAAFDQLARFQDLGNALEGFEGAALAIFAGNLFAENAG